MKSTNLNKYLLISLVMIIFSSCETNENDSMTISFGDRLDIYNLSIQEFEIDPLKDNYLKGKQGSIIKITKEAIVKYEITKVSIFEALDKQTMIKAGLTTMSNGKILESDGMIHLQISSKFGDTLNLVNSGCEVYFPKSDNSKQMKLFHGENVNENVNWNLSESPLPILKFATDTTGNFGYRKVAIFSDFYCFPLSKNGWINADMFLKIEEKVDFICEAPSDNVNAIYYLVFDDFKGILTGNNHDGNITYSNVPKGLKAKIIGMGIKEKEVYLSVDLVNLNNLSRTRLSKMKQVSLAELNAKLKSINN